MKRGSAAVIATACIIGIILIAGVIIIFVMAKNESDKLYQEMVDEVKNTEAEVELTPEEMQAISESYTKPLGEIQTSEESSKAAESVSKN